MEIKGLIVVNVEKCLGCHSCEIACAVEHSRSKQLFSAISEAPLPKSRVAVEHYGSARLPLQCRHCDNAPCIKVCPTKAMLKEAGNGAVLIDHSLCIGCKWCLLVCPFGAVTLDNDEKAVLKCDLCYERTSTGRVPACVYSCPTGALQFTSVEELIKKKRRDFLVDFLGAVK
ncbi:MAG: 4Fe-4S dicluster domain-containing protein [Dethiobacteria bacterium]|jgi:carbon-monoxide dehydrogenase iron sulfur subunit